MCTAVIRSLYTWSCGEKLDLPAPQLANSNCSVEDTQVFFALITVMSCSCLQYQLVRKSKCTSGHRGSVYLLSATRPTIRR